MPKGDDSSVRYMAETRLEDHVLNQFLAPYRVPHITDQNASKRATAIITYVARYILPTLTPGLVALAKAVEADELTDDVVVPDLDGDLDMQSMELKIYFAKHVNKVGRD